MSETFRIRKAVKITGIFFTVLFLVVTLAHASIPFLIEQGQHGFNGENSTIIAGGRGVAVYGTMTLLSIYMLIAYRIERFSIAGNTISVRSVFQNRRFENFEIQKIVWKIAPRCGRIAFYVFNHKTVLDLYGFDKPDRLRIIRLVHSLVPEEKQEGWPVFCLNVAIPLRDGRKPKPPVTADDSVPPKSTEVLISRKRYDRALIFVFPLSIIAAAMLWRATNLVAFWFVLPILVMASWLLLRFSVPREGKRQDRLLSTPVGQYQVFGWALITGSQIAMATAIGTGVVRDRACTVGLIVLVPAIIPFAYMMLRANRYEKAKQASAATFVLDDWNHGEADRTIPAAAQILTNEEIPTRTTAILAN